MSLSPRGVEGGVQMMAGINRRCCTPVAVLVYQPSTRTQALHDSFERGFLSAGEVGEHKPHANEIKRPGFERLEWTVKDVVLDDLEVWDFEPLEVGDVDVGGHDLARRAYLFRQPERHRSASGADFKATPPRLNDLAAPARPGVIDLLKQAQPLILGRLASCSRQTVARLRPLSRRRRDRGI